MCYDKHAVPRLAPGDGRPEQKFPLQFCILSICENHFFGKFCSLCRRLRQ